MTIIVRYRNCDRCTTIVTRPININSFEFDSKRGFLKPFPPCYAPAQTMNGTRKKVFCKKVFASREEVKKHRNKVEIIQHKRRIT